MSWHTAESGCCVGRGCLGPDPSEAPHVGGFRSWQSGLVPPPSQDQGSGRHWGSPRAKHGAPPSGPGHGPVGGALGGQQGALGHGQSRGSTSQAGQGQAGLVMPSGPRHGWSKIFFRRRNTRGTDAVWQSFLRPKGLLSP